MLITKITLDGYKRFHDLTIDLWDTPSRIVALIWPNWCGKSSIFDWMLYKANAYDLIWNKSRKDWKFHSITWDSNYTYQKVKIFFWDIEYEDLRSDKTRQWNSQTIFSFRNSYRYNSSVNVTQTVALTSIEYNKYWATQSTDLDDKMTENYQRLLIKYNQYLNEQDCSPSVAKKTIIGELNDSIENCLDLKIDNLGDIQASRWTIYFTKLWYPNIFPFDVLSSWEKEVVDILLDLYLRKDQYDDTVYIIDEPELHINTAIQRSLLIEINRLIPQNCQIRIATHSIWFLRALQEELNDESSIIEFTSDMQSASEILHLTPIIKSRTNWQRIFHTALDDLTGLVSPQRIVYCEWDPHPNIDWFENWFDAMVYNTIFEEEHHETLFISSDWCRQVESYSSIALQVLWKWFSWVELLKLTDRDHTTLKDREDWLNESWMNRMLNRYSIENFLLDKEVIKKLCSNGWCVFDEAFYNSQITDIRNNKVKNKIWPIKQNIKFTGTNMDFIKSLISQITKETSIYKELEECIF